MPHVPDASSDVVHFDPSAHHVASVSNGSSDTSKFGCNSDDEGFHSESETITNMGQLAHLLAQGQL